MKYIYKASILCMLACGTTSSMELGNIVNVQQVGVELVGLLLGNTKLTKKNLFDLIRHLKAEKALEVICGLTSEQIETFFDVERLNEFFACLTTETDNSRHALQLKAIALQRTIKIPAWEQAFGCTQLETAVKHLSQLIYFTGTQEHKESLIRQLKQDITRLRPESSEDPCAYEQYLSIPKIQALLDAHLAGEPITHAAILETLALDTIIKERKLEDGIFTVFHAGTALPLLASLYWEESPEVLSPKLLLLFRLDKLVDHLPTLLSLPTLVIEQCVSTKDLKLLLRALQAGEPITEERVQAAVKGKFLEPYIECEALAHALNTTQKGENFDLLKEAIHLKELGELVGIDLEELFDTTLPEEAQKHALTQTVDLFTYDGFYEYAKETGKNCLATLPLLWAAYQIYPSYVFVGGLTTAASGWYYYKGLPEIPERPLIMLCNSLAIKATRLMAGKIPTDPASTLLTKTTGHPQREELERFIELCKEELNSIERPIAIFSIFDANEVYTFICSNEKFIEHLCAGEHERAHARLMMIHNQLQTYKDRTTLPQAAEYNRFMNELVSTPNTQELIQTLPHQTLLVLGEYRPQLVVRHPEFMMMITPLRQGSVVKHLYAACLLAKQLEI